MTAKCNITQPVINGSDWINSACLMRRKPARSKIRCLCYEYYNGERWWIYLTRLLSSLHLSSFSWKWLKNIILNYKYNVLFFSESMNGPDFQSLCQIRWHIWRDEWEMFKIKTFLRKKRTIVPSNITSNASYKIKPHPKIKNYNENIIKILEEWWIFSWIGTSIQTAYNHKVLCCNAVSQNSKSYWHHNV